MIRVSTLSTLSLMILSLSACPQQPTQVARPPISNNAFSKSTSSVQQTSPQQALTDPARNTPQNTQASKTSRPSEAQSTLEQNEAVQSSETPATVQSQVRFPQVKRLRMSLKPMRMGETQQAQVQFLDDRHRVLNGDFPLRFESTDPQLFSISAEGQIQALKAQGKAMIRVFLEGTDLMTEVPLQLQRRASSGGGGGGGSSSGGGTGGSPAAPPADTPGHAHHDHPGDPHQTPTGDFLRWSEAETWTALGVTKPEAGDAVVIPAGQRVLLDESTPDLAGLRIDGELQIAQGQDIELQADYVMVHGTLRAGSAHAPFDGRFTLTLNDLDSEASAHGPMGTRGLFSMGGRLELFGRAPQTVWTKINAHLPAGSTQLTLLEAQGWQVGDQLAIAPTDFYGTGESERLHIAAVNGTQVSVQQGPQTARWGLLQYLGPNGMNLNPTGFVPASDTPTVLDERAAVGNLSRNIVIQSADDALWQNQGFGAQVMIMGNDAHTQINGVEIRRAGQAGRMARYPIHFHVLSYDRSGAERPPGGVREIRNNAIWDSRNRCVTIHGTNDVILDRNICYDIDGHAVFLEDAVERRNQITNNLVLRVRAPEQALIDSDRPRFTRGPSGFWLTNPDNTVTGNLAADAQGNGFWMAFPEAPLGLNTQVPIQPYLLPFGTFDDNTTHSNGEVGIQLDWVPFNAAGETRPQSYSPMIDGQPHGYDYEYWDRLAMNRITTFKNRGSGFWNRTTWPDYDRWVSADNLGVFFAGAGADGYITRALVVGESLNNATTWRDPVASRWSGTPAEPPVAFASYHSTFNMQHNSIVNFPFVSGQSSGAFKTDDYYITSVDKGLVRNANNQLINSHPGFRSPVRTAENWTLAGALWDPYGYWGPAGNYWVYDDAFLTAELDCQAVAPAGENGMSCNSEYFGVGGFVVDNSERYMPEMPIQATRFANDGSVLGQWSVGDGRARQAFSNMRHFAAVPNGLYLLEFPGDPIPSQRVELGVSNAYREGDSFILGVSFSSGVTPNVYVSAPYTNTPSLMQATDSLENVAASNGDLYWQDSENQRVWVKLQAPGVAPEPLPGEELLDQNLYRGFRLHVEAP